MGDMCVCVGPPDVIAKGSTGVLIMGMPAARMGDLTTHGGSIVVGFPTVLIGEVMPGSPPVVMPPVVIVNIPSQTAKSAGKPANQLFEAMKSAPEAAKVVIAQAITLVQAAEDGTPFCEICEKKRIEREEQERLNTSTK
jgi:hypothetical protein